MFGYLLLKRLVQATTAKASRGILSQYFKPRPNAAAKLAYITQESGWAL